MKRQFSLFLFLLVFLSGCGQKREPDVEYFQADVVATLQKPASQADEEMAEDTPSPNESPQPLPQASEPIPSLAPVSTLTPTPTVSDPQVTNYPLNYETTTVPQDAYPTEDLTQTPTPTLGNTDWDGVWNIWYQAASGGYTPAQLTVQVSGTRLIGTTKISGTDFSFKGDISLQGTQVEGEWQTASDTGNFWWRMNSPETFVGSRESRFGFCGNRAAVQPNLCRDIP